MNRLSPRLWTARVVQFGSAEQIGRCPSPKLNIARRPIASKYSDGKMQRTLKIELKVPETDEWQEYVTRLIPVTCFGSVTGRLDRVALTTACLSFVSRVQIGDAL